MCRDREYIYIFCVYVLVVIDTDLNVGWLDQTCCWNNPAVSSGESLSHRELHQYEFNVQEQCQQLKEYMI